MSSPRATEPPWHLWGNSQIVKVTVQPGGLGFVPRLNLNTLARVFYGRPETWHWLFFAKLVSGPNSTPGENLNVGVNFNVTLGMGRTAIQLNAVQGTQNRPLDSLSFQLGPADPVFPVGAHLYSTTGQSSRLWAEAVPAGIDVNQIVAETIVCEANVTAIASPGNVLALGAEVQIEVAAFFSPKNHIRPDWFQPDVPPEVQFPGGEVPSR